MDNKKAAAHIRKEIDKNRNIFSWVTDGCGYDQHIRFVNHRNENWLGGTREEWRAFVLDYADMLERKDDPAVE